MSANRGKGRISLTDAQDRAMHRVRAMASVLAAGLAIASLAPEQAAALPSFAVQTSQACSACHVGSFGPQLKRFGRDFKLFGYSTGFGKNPYPPISMMAVASYTHTKADQSPPEHHYDTNDNVALGEASLFYGGRLFQNAGLFAQVTYDGITRTVAVDNIDARYASRLRLFGKPMVAGIDLNNNPGVQDLWNSSPAWRFPYNTSPLAPSPSAAPIIDGALAHKVAGAGLYALWNDLIYVEAAGYTNIDRPTLKTIGDFEGPGEDRYKGISPYWRVAVQHDFGEAHYIELGAYGIEADRYPGGDRSARTDRLRDIALDATYQYDGDKHYFSAHASHIHEAQDLAASSALIGVRRRNSLTVTHADLSYSY